MYFKVGCFLGFLIHCVHVLKVCPKTAGNYCAGTLHFLEKGYNINVTEIRESSLVRATKAGLLLEFALKNPNYKRVRLPFTVEAILFAQANIFNDKSNPVHDCIILAMMFLLCTLARVSEALLHPHSAVHHHVKANEILFLVTCDDLNEPVFIDASVASLDTANKYTVLELVISRTSAKNDLVGAGNNFFFRSDDSKDFAQFCSKMLRLGQTSSPLSRRPFLFIPEHLGSKI